MEALDLKKELKLKVMQIEENKPKKVCSAAPLCDRKGKADISIVSVEVNESPYNFFEERMNIDEQVIAETLPFVNFYLLVM